LYSLRQRTLYRWTPRGGGGGGGGVVGNVE